MSLALSLMVGWSKYFCAFSMLFCCRSGNKDTLSLWEDVRAECTWSSHLEARGLSSGKTTWLFCFKLATVQLESNLDSFLLKTAISVSTLFPFPEKNLKSSACGICICPCQSSFALPETSIHGAWRAELLHLELCNSNISKAWKTAKS